MAIPATAQTPPRPPVQYIPVGTAQSYLGIGLAKLDPQRAKTLNLREESGAEITRVEDGSPADKAGLRAGDAILEFNGHKVEGVEQIGRLVRETPAGKEVKLLVSRGSELMTIMVKTGSRTAMEMKPADPWNMPMPSGEMPVLRLPDMPRTVMSWRNSLLGIESETLEGQLAQYFGVKEGVLVRSVAKSSVAEAAGLRAGDVIFKVGDRRVATPSEVSSTIQALGSKKTLWMTVMRDRKEVSLSIPAQSGR